MRVFLIWADYAQKLKPLVEEIEKKSHQVVYWAGLADGNESAIAGPIFHDHNAAWTGTPAKGIDPSEFPPPGKELIEKMYKTESLILSMLNKRFGWMCVDERRHLYYNLLQYWLGMINKFKPDLIIFPIIPHTIYNFIIYDLAKLLGIRTFMFENTDVSDRLLMHNDWVRGSGYLREAIGRNREIFFSVDDLSPDLQKHYRLHTDPSGDATPAYLKTYKADNKGWRLIKRKLTFAVRCFKDGSIIGKTLRYLLKFSRSNLKKEYAKFEIKPDLSRKYVYSPLNYQPERTTCPQGDMFADQILMLEILSFSLPKDWVIYVKEHPSQWLMGSRTNYSASRYPGYYKRIAALKNVFLVPIETNTYSLTNNSQAIATVTGTAGWEALLRGKPAIIFGNPWFRDCPHLFRVYDAKSCAEAFEKIAAGFRVDKQKIINFIRSFDEATIHGYLEDLDAVNSELTEEENRKNIIQAVLNEIEK